ncbi:hypothetical protein MMC17_000248 [Xylographa soralifera]|nr:hypothetical protein [Xylographa soralifera]
MVPQGNDNRITGAREGMIRLMDTFVRVWFRQILDQALQWTSDGGILGGPGIVVFPSNQEIHSSTRYTYGELLRTVLREIKFLETLLTATAEDLGLQFPLADHGSLSISPVPFSESLVSVLVVELLLRHGNLAPPDRVRRSLLELPTSAQRARIFSSPAQQRIFPRNANVDRFFLRGQAIECAVDQQGRVFCGSSAIYWDKMYNMRLDVASLVGIIPTIETWFPGIRQRRFSAPDQAKLTTIIDRACDDFDAFRQNHQAQGDFNPDQGAANDLLARYSPGSSPLCASMRQGANRPEYWAQAYIGSVAEFKDKCTMCRAVFHLKTVLADASMISRNFAEKGTKEPRGKCAEALVHAQLYTANNLAWN